MILATGHLRRGAAAVAALLLASMAVCMGAAAAERHRPGCNTAACDKRVSIHMRGYPMCNTWACVERVKLARYDRLRKRWARAVRAYGPDLLRARVRCESGRHGGYQLGTTGNGFWFAHQFEPRAWAGAGGRIDRLGRPHGWLSPHPTRLEQDYRAVAWDRIHGGDPWPHCP